MPTSGNSIGEASLASLNTPKVNNNKSVVISTVDNGFVLQFQKVTEYGQTYKVAKEISEIPELLTSYFSNPEVIEA